jgi:hypothetical protein
MAKEADNGWRSITGPTTTSYQRVWARPWSVADDLQNCTELQKSTASAVLRTKNTVSSDARSFFRQKEI